MTQANGARPQTAARIAVVITDGRSARPDLTQQEVELIHKSGIYVFSIGMNVTLIICIACFFGVLCACFCMGHFVLVPLNLTCLHCLEHSLFEYLFNLKYYLRIYSHILYLVIKSTTYFCNEAAHYSSWMTDAPESRGGIICKSKQQMTRIPTTPET